MAEGWLSRGPCLECGSSNGNVQHSDGHSFCFVCNTRFSNNEGSHMQSNTTTPVSSTSLKSGGYLAALTDRKISENSAKVYNTFVNDNGGTDQSHHIYKYFDKDGEHIASKVRKTESKDF